MLLVGLTGGIGSGKSTVAAHASRSAGAVVFDADLLARRGRRTGHAWSHGRDRDGSVAGRPRAGRRARPRALASIVFADPRPGADLEAIVHPEVRTAVRGGVGGVPRHRPDRRRVQRAAAGRDRGCTGASTIVVVVSATVATQIERLMRAARHVEAAIVRASIAQAPLEDKRAQVADFLVDNEGHARRAREPRSSGSGTTCPPRGRLSARTGPRPLHRYPDAVTSSGYAAVFFDAGETLVHPHPTFPDLFARDRAAARARRLSRDDPRARARRVRSSSAQAAEANELWTTSPERSRRFWHGVYGIFLRELGSPTPTG